MSMRKTRLSRCIQLSGATCRGVSPGEVSRCGDDAVPVLGVRGTAWCGASTAHSRHSGALRYPGDPYGYANGRAASSRFQGQRPSR